jgi:hypothetical protein
MEKIPKAQDYLKDNVYITNDGVEDVHDSLSSVSEAMIKFAELHVEAALKAASESKCINMLGKPWRGYSLEPGTKILDVVNISVNKDSILNSYPLTNIK